MVERCFLGPALHRYDKLPAQTGRSFLKSVVSKIGSCMRMLRKRSQSETLKLDNQSSFLPIAIS
jgi:hypothetical protein